MVTARRVEMESKPVHDATTRCTGTSIKGERFLEKNLGKKNDLIKRLKKSKAFEKVNFREVLKPKSYVGMAPAQVNQFLKDVVMPICRKYRKELNKKVELKV